MTNKRPLEAVEATLLRDTLLSLEDGYKWLLSKPICEIPDFANRILKGDLATVECVLINCREIHNYLLKRKSCHPDSTPLNTSNSAPKLDANSAEIPTNVPLGLAEMSAQELADLTDEQLDKVSQAVQQILAKG